MKRILSVVTAVLVALLTLTTCRPLREVPVEYKEITREKLVPVAIPGDSAEIKILFDCDKGIVRMTPLSSKTSSGMQLTTQWDGSTLTITPTVLPRNVWLPYREVEVTRDKVVTQTIEKVVYRATWWQSLLAWVGGITIAVITVIITIKIKKS